MKIKEKILSHLKRGGLFSCIGVALSGIPAFAASNSWYTNNNEILVNNSIALDALRIISWGITGIICKICDVCETLYDKTFGLIDITQYGEINSLITKLQPVLVALTTACLIGLGITLMVSREKRSNLLRNILMSILAVSCSLYAFTALNNLAYSFKEGILSENTTINQSYTLVDNNIVDLIRQDTEGNINNLNYSKGVVKIGAHINGKSSFAGIDYNEKLNFAEAEKGKDLYKWSDTFNDYIMHRTVNAGENTEKVENYSGWFTTTLGNEFYYRYHFDFLTCILQVCSLLVVFISLSYKNVRIAYELIVSRLMAFLFAADISSGEKLKGTLIFIRDTYITLCVSVLCIKLYEVMTAFLTASGITGIAKGIISLFIAFAVIDGPNLVERLLGMDAGLRSSFARSWAAISAGVATGRALTGGAKNVAMGAATGKTARQRVEERKGGGHAEWAAAKTHNKLFAGTTKSDEGRAESENIKQQATSVEPTVATHADASAKEQRPGTNSRADQQLSKMNASSEKSTGRAIPKKRIQSTSKYVNNRKKTNVKKKGDN